MVIRSSSLLAILLLLLLAACGGEEPAPPAATSTMPEPVSVPDTEVGVTVLVTVNDGSIALREQAIPPGPVVMTVANAGQQLPGLHVEGPGVNAALAEPIGAGGSGTVSATLQAGEYTFYCPLLDHREKGERVTITIGSAG